MLSTNQPVSLWKLCKFFQSVRAIIPLINIECMCKYSHKKLISFFFIYLLILTNMIMFNYRKFSKFIMLIYQYANNPGPSQKIYDSTFHIWKYASQLLKRKFIMSIHSVSLPNICNLNVYILWKMSKQHKKCLHL